MHIELIREPAQLASYLNAWRGLSPTPMQSPEWMLAWWQAYATPTMQLHTLVVRSNDGEVLGLAPLYKRGGWGIGPSLRLLGSGQVCTDFQTILAKVGHENDVAKKVAQWLIDSVAAGDAARAWGTCELDGVSAACPAVQCLLGHLRAAGCTLHSMPNENTWRLDLDGGWDQVLARQSKTQRSQSRNLLNRLAKYPHLSIDIARTAETLPQAVEDLRRLHQARWTEIGEKGCFSDERFELFASLVCSRLAENGNCSIYTLRDAGQAVACQWVLTDPQGYFVYQTGRDPQRESQHVGRILNLAMLRNACEEGIPFVDYLRGNELYKQRLGAVSSECLKLRVIAPRPLPRLGHRATLMGQGIKRAIKQLAEKSGLRPVKQPSPAKSSAETAG